MTTPNSDTPRTDTLLRNVSSDHEDMQFAEIVHLAEDLERELAEARERNESLQACNNAQLRIGIEQEGEIAALRNQQSAGTQTCNQPEVIALVGAFEVACTHGDMAAQFTTKGELLDAIVALRAERDGYKQGRDLQSAVATAALDERDGLREALTRAAENMKIAAEFHDCVNCMDGEKQARAALKGKP